MIWSKRCRHPKLRRISASWGEPPWPAECPDCKEFIPWMTDKDGKGCWVNFCGVRTWQGP